MAQKSKHPIESKPQISADLTDYFPDSHLVMFMGRDEALIAKSKLAYVRKDSGSVHRVPSAAARILEIASPLRQKESEKPFGVSPRIGQKGTA